ncbi:hypothetical protein F6R98_14585 [Candidatus Methylospira mobilis]|uniref:Uncharacterized protein n=1 Tax=Candidatus Methylospira mobilis TaxID=1808979 RepID=A0A5Q0BKN8_9GAMM|nr:hypothetical protein [Candidatus Methylospira mobilis]QFY43702.1 hypothetical protein F6R98_14585 [Candidatus Methylospira mobilis]
MKYDRYVILDCELACSNILRKQRDISFTKFKSHEADYIRLDPITLMNPPDNALGELTPFSKIIIIGHGSKKEATISPATNNSIDKDLSSITPDLIATFLQKYIPMKAGHDDEERVYEIRSGFIKRRLTLQLCVCYAADINGEKEILMSSLYEQFIAKQLQKIHLVGYKKKVWTTQIQRFPLHHKLGELQLAKMSPGDKFEFFKKNQERINNKFIITPESYDDYNNKQKDSPLLCYDIDWKMFRLEILKQLHVEIKSDHWSTKGQKFFGDKKPPTGIQEIRKLFREESFSDETEYDPHKHGDLFKKTLKIINSRLKNSGSNRDTYTTDFYQRYKETMEMDTP